MAGSIDLAKDAVLNLFKAYSLDKELIFGEISELHSAEENQIYDYTGLIGISGGFRGGIYVTCKSAFLEFVYKRLTHQDPERPLKRAFSDLVGELANTLAGYFQKECGDQFLISVPCVIVGGSEIGILKKKIYGGSNSFALPFLYDKLESILAVSVDSIKK